MSTFPKMAPVVLGLHQGPSHNIFTQSRGIYFLNTVVFQLIKVVFRQEQVLFKIHV